MENNLEEIMNNQLEKCRKVYAGYDRSKMNVANDFIKTIFTGIKIRNNFKKLGLDASEKYESVNDQLIGLFTCEELDIIIDSGYVSFSDFLTINQERCNILMEKNSQENGMIPYEDELNEVMETKKMLDKDIIEFFIHKNLRINIVEGIGSDSKVIIIPTQNLKKSVHVNADSVTVTVSSTYFQQILEEYLRRSIKEEMSVETWKIIRKRLAELKEKAVINDEFIDQIQPTLEHIKQSIKKQNADFNNIKKIKELLNLSIITPKDIIDETPDEVIHDMLKSSSHMFKGWSDYEILQLIDKKDINTHEYKQLLDGRNMNIVKAIENAAREKTIQNFGPIEMYNFNEGIENSEFLMRLLNKIPRQYIGNISDDLMDIYLNGFNSLTTIPLTNQDILKLLKEGIIDEKRIVDLYEQQQNNTSEYIDDIDNQEFLEFLTIDRMVNIVNDQDLTQRFKKMYNNLINQQSKEENEHRWKNVLDKYMQSEKSQEEKEKEIAKLISERILPIHTLDEDTILNLAESRQLPYDLLVEEFMQGNISRNMIETVISSQEIPELSAKSLRNLYIEEVISIENLKNLDDEKIQELRRELIEIILPEDEEKRNHYMSKLNNAYMEDIIDFETLTRMKDNGILSEEEYAKMRELYDEKIALKKLKEIEYIVCETEAEQGEERKKGPPENETPTRDSRYMKYIINEFGGETTTEEYIKPIYGGNLDKYYMIIQPKARIVILESPIHGNATYILPLKVALEFVQTKNKKDLKGTFGVEHLNHSKNWKINLEERARKVQKSIGVQVKPNVVWLDEGDEPR